MKIRLIVPNGTGKNSHLCIVEQLYGLLIADIAGGFTATQATGGWKDASGKLIVEPVTVFDCHDDVPADGYNRAVNPPVDCRDDWRDLARDIARELSQTCVYLEIDGVVEYVKG